MVIIYINVERALIVRTILIILNIKFIMIIYAVNFKAKVRGKLLCI